MWACFRSLAVDHGHLDVRAERPLAHPDVAGAGVVVLTVPLSAHVETLKAIRGSLAPAAILVDATVPLEIAIGGRLSRMLTLWDGSAAQQAARLLPGVAVVAAFHALSAEALAKLDHPLDCDTLICGDSAEVNFTTMGEAPFAWRAPPAGVTETSFSGATGGVTLTFVVTWWVVTG